MIVQDRQEIDAQRMRDRTPHVPQSIRAAVFHTTRRATVRIWAGVVLGTGVWVSVQVGIWSNTAIQAAWDTLIIRTALVALVGLVYRERFLITSATLLDLPQAQYHDPWDRNL